MEHVCVMNREKGRKGGRDVCWEQTEYRKEVVCCMQSCGEVAFYVDIALARVYSSQCCRVIESSQENMVKALHSASSSLKFKDTLWCLYSLQALCTGKAFCSIVFGAQRHLVVFVQLESSVR